MGALAGSLPAGWTSTSSLLIPRFGHTATLVPSVNWVLVAGGSDTSGRSGNHPLASSEIYYAQLGRWGPVADMLEARYGHAAVFLRHGPGETRDQVLVLGGVGTRGALASAELFDPLTKTWRATRPMSRPRGSPLATLLADGRVLVTGGSTAKSFASADAEIYDPATGTWSSTGAMATPRSVYVQALLPDGGVMVAGGATPVTNPVTGRPVGKSLDAVEIWNPQTGAWSAGPTLESAKLCGATCGKGSLKRDDRRGVTVRRPFSARPPGSPSRRRRRAYGRRGWPIGDGSQAPATADRHPLFAEHASPRIRRGIADRSPWS